MFLTAGGFIDGYRTKANAAGFGAAEGLNVHKYKVGETVRYTSNVMRRFGATGRFMIVRLLPSEGAERQYQIKSTTESHERVAKESQLDQDDQQDQS